MAKILLNPDRQTERDVSIALRKLKNAVEDDGTLKDIQKHTAYVKPTTKRKMKAAAAKSRHRREQAKNKLPDKQF